MRNRMLIVAAFVAVALTASDTVASETVITPAAAAVAPVPAALRESIPTVEPELDLTEGVTVHEMTTPIEGAVRSNPDVTHDNIVGGIAVRLHTRAGVKFPGDVFQLMGRDDNTTPARVWDETPYTYPQSERKCFDSLASNINANFVANLLTGANLPVLDITVPSGCGPSTGIAYTLGYLNAATDGAFTGDLKVAGTGELTGGGHYRTVGSVQQKLPAAWLAGADVMFTSNMPDDVTHSSLDLPTRVGGRDESRRVHVTDPADRVAFYREYGASRPTNGMDLVVVQHVADVVAYLCGAGSDIACETLDVIDADMVNQLMSLPATSRTVEDEYRSA